MSIPGPSNTVILTHQNKVWSAKRKQKREQVKEIVFDEDARRDYLTGFHKRKLARKEASKANALEREKQERLEARREKRRALAEQAAKNAIEVERAYGATDSGDPTSLDNGKADADPEEMGFSNEEQLATVTIVEDFDPVDPASTSHPGVQFTSDEGQQSRPKIRGPVRSTQVKTIVKARKPPKSEFAYETKAVRKYEKKKQAARRDQKSRFAKGRQMGKRNEKQR